MSNARTVAEEVATYIGGPDNVSWVGSCTTRLRFVVRDESQVDFDALNAIPGVLQAIRAGGQVQVVIGTHVDTVRAELLRRDGWIRLADADQNGPAARRRPLDVVFDFLGGTFQPLVAPITGAAMVQVLALLLTQFGWLDAESTTALVLTATGNALFYFLPLFVAFTASRKLGVNPFIGATVAAALLHPSFTAIGQTGDVAQAFGLPLFVYSYASSMFPSLMIALALWGLDKLLKKILPQLLQQVFVPTLELLILVPLTALVFGPVGVLVGNGIGTGTTWLATNAPFLFYLIVPALWIFMVAFGIHWALISIAIAQLATDGSTQIIGAGAGYQYAMMGIALAVLIKAARERNTSLRDTAAAASTAVVIGGITEPTLYGLVLPYRRVLVIQIISAAASGAVLGLFSVAAVGFAPAPILGLPLMQPILGAALAMAVGIVLPIVLVQVWGYQPTKPTDTTATPTQEGFRGAVEGGLPAQPVTIAAPLTGEVVELSSTTDPVFSGGLIGPGVAIQPTGNVVTAPVDGVIVAAPGSAHAIGVRSDDGVEILIHVGIDTVKLKGEHFRLRVSQGQRVARGDLLLEFDKAAIERLGYSMVTPVVVTNVRADQRVIPLASSVVAGEPLFSLDAVAV